MHVVPLKKVHLHPQARNCLLNKIIIINIIIWILLNALKNKLMMMMIIKNNL